MTSPRRILAFDWGLRNIGVAVGNGEFGTSEPHRIIRARDGVPDWDLIKALISEWQPDLVLVGEPLNMDGSDAEITSRARRFSRQIEGRFNVPVTLVDERLSSFEAKADQRERGHKGNYREQPIDADAADIILRTWLSQQQ